MPGPSKSSNAAIVLLVVGGGVIAMFVVLGILGALGIYGTRRYIANAKRIEATSTLGALARGAVAAYEARASETGKGELCPSARSPIPASIQQVSAKKYQSAPTEWANDPGFSCLRFEMTTPQYYQYDYSRVGSSFTAAARGDLDGDGILSTFETKGRVENDRVTIAPSIEETNPDE
jgi:type IV pilus assembly protein PilA